METDRSPAVIVQLKTLIFDNIISIINRQLIVELITVSDANMLKEFLLKLYNYLYADYSECEKGGVNAMVEDEIIFQTDMLIAETTEKVTKELNAKYAKHAKELTEKLAEKDRIISAYQLLAKHTPVAQIPKRLDCPKRPSVLFKA